MRMGEESRIIYNPTRNISKFLPSPDKATDEMAAVIRLVEIRAAVVDNNDAGSSRCRRLCCDHRVDNRRGGLLLRRRGVALRRVPISLRRRGEALGRWGVALLRRVHGLLGIILRRGCIRRLLRIALWRSITLGRSVRGDCHAVRRRGWWECVGRTYACVLWLPLLRRRVRQSLYFNHWCWLHCG
jgi:hypothetical protein